MEHIDFIDKITNKTPYPNLFFQTLIVEANSKHDIQLNMQGLLYNPNNFSCKIIINSTNGKLTKTLQAKQYFSVPYVYVNSIVNTGNGNIEFYFTNSEFGEFSTSELVNILGSVSLTNDSVNVYGQISGSVELTNDSINILGSVNVVNNIDATITGSVNLTNDSINVSGSVNVLGSVELTNDSINILGSVNVVNNIDATITGSVGLTNDSINVSGSVNVLGSVELTNDSINVIGSVAITSDVNALITGSVNITNDSINVSGSVNVLGSVELTNDSINILGSVNVVNNVDATITGSVNLTNDSINITGSVNLTNDSINVNVNNTVNSNIVGTVSVSNDITGTVSVSNAVSITGSVEVSNQFNGSVNVVNDINGSISIQSQADAVAVNESFNTFYIDATKETTSNYTNSSITINITLQPNSIIRFKSILVDIRFLSDIYLQDDTGVLGYFLPTIETTNNGGQLQSFIDVFVQNGNIQASIPINIPRLKNQVAYVNGVYQILSGSTSVYGNYPIIFEYERQIVNTGTSAINLWVKWLLQNGADSITTYQAGFLLEGEISGSFTYTIDVYNAGNDSTSSSSGSGGGGGCFTADTEFYGEYKGVPVVKKFKDFKVGDMILTINGFEPIEKIYDMGIQTVYELDTNLKITDSQPFTLYNGDVKRTVLDVPNIVKSIYKEHTYDCKVKSVWLLPVSNAVYAIEDITKVKG